MEQKHAKSLQASARNSVQRGKLDIEVSSRGKKKKSAYQNNNFNVEQLIDSEIWDSKIDSTQLKTEGIR